MPTPLPSLAAPDNDPYLWLEEVEGARALDWVEAQNTRTMARLGGLRYEADRDTLTEIFDRPDNIPFVSRRGSFLYNFWKDAANPRGLWRRTTAESYRTSAPEWEVILDIDALAAAEGEDWIWSGPDTLRGSHDRAILRLSRGGSDAAVTREFDLVSKRFVEGGFTLPEAKGGTAWVDQDTLLVMTALGEDATTISGYARKVKLWRRGTDFASAPVVFEVPRDHLRAWAGVDATSGANRAFFVDVFGFFDNRVAIGTPDGPTQVIDCPTDVRIEFFDDWLVLKPRLPWQIGAATHSPDRLLGIRLSAYLAGSRDFHVLFEPSERRALQGFFWSGGKLILSILDDLSPCFLRVTPSDGGWSAEPLEGLPRIGVVQVWSVDNEEAESTGELFANAQDPLTPPTLYQLPPLGVPEYLKRAPSTYTADGLIVSRHDAVSIDGERIPYIQVGPAAETGDAPVHLYAYGGFAVSEMPYYRRHIGKLWLERGGTSVIANIRGGGEFGTRWHDAGRREGKRLAHDDFAAVAADLMRRGVTVPQRIAAEGGSNGGILITNMLTRYPERFGALFCTIPLIDMRRYSKLLAGASWIAEYGDPDKPEDWAYLQHYSAYHNVESGRTYPPILIATSKKDDRVHPGHARKMAAKLQDLGYEALFHEPPAGGHGYGKDNRELASFIALGYGFLRRAIGWELP